MIVVDTNVLVYAHREEFTEHAAAMNALQGLARGARAWGVPVFCLAEFVRVVTHRRVLSPPSTVQQASAFIDALGTSSSFRLLLPDDSYWSELRTILLTKRVAGNPAFDAQIAAVCLSYGAVLLTHDRDFASLGIETRSL